MTESSQRFWIVAATLGGMAAGIAVVRVDPQPAVVPREQALEGGGPREPIAPIPPARGLDPRKLALGERLFRDARLSGDGTVSCASCHDLESSGADTRRYSVGAGGVLGARNAPTVFNSSLNFRQFWDGRARDLREQVDGPLLDPREMASDWERVLSVLAKDEEYVSSFEALYGGIEEDGVRDALATFESSLVTPGAPFDRWLRGDESALSADALAGYRLFKDLGCIACHQGVGVGGNMFQRVGVASTDAPPPDDPGRYAVTGEERDRHAFKVPSLRNVALTAPYFHDGSAATLDEAVRVMARAQLGLELADADLAVLVAFLESLTGERPR